MTLLISGLVIWVLVHFIPSLAQPLKKGIIDSLGDTPYKLIFTVLIIASLVLIVLGWRQTIPDYLYNLPTIFRNISISLMAVVFILFSSSSSPNRFKNLVGHPQLVAVVLWAVAHLLSNGDSRSVVLFGAMAVWGVFEIVFINKRDGKPVAQPVFGWGQEIKILIIGLVIFFIVAKLHPYFTGMSVIAV